MSSIFSMLISGVVGCGLAVVTATGLNFVAASGGATGGSTPSASVDGESGSGAVITESIDLYGFPLVNYGDVQVR